MASTIKQLIVFFLNGDIGPDLLPTIDVMDQQRLRVAAIRLFHWLTGRAKKPLFLENDTEWSHNVCDMIRAVKGLDDMFIVSPDSIDFRSDISEDYREEVRQFIRQHYRPQLHTTAKRK